MPCRSNNIFKREYFVLLKLSSINFIIVSRSSRDCAVVAFTVDVWCCLLRRIMVWFPGDVVVSWSKTDTQSSRPCQMEYEISTRCLLTHLRDQRKWRRYRHVVTVSYRWSAASVGPDDGNKRLGTPRDRSNATMASTPREILRQLSRDAYEMSPAARPGSTDTRTLGQRIIALVRNSWCDGLLSWLVTSAQLAAWMATEGCQPLKPFHSPTKHHRQIQ